MPILANERKALEELKQLLKEKYSVTDIKVYGSKIKGTDTADSDLDIMITLEQCTPLIESKIDDLIFDLNIKHDCFITVLYFCQEEIETGPLSQSPIYKKIIQEGVSP